MITGHTGFKGSWLSLCLKARGADVDGYASAPPSEPSPFELADVSGQLTAVTGDIRNYKLLRDSIADWRPEIVFHVAAQSLVRRSYQDAIETYSTNVLGTVHLLEAVREACGDCVVINVTSDKCYENMEWARGYRCGAGDRSSRARVGVSGWVSGTEGGCAEDGRSNDLDRADVRYLGAVFQPQAIVEHWDDFHSCRVSGSADGEVESGGDVHVDALRGISVTCDHLP